MIDRSKFSEVFDLSIIDEPINIIGAGAIGSTVGMVLARMGADKVRIWDDDEVESKNIGNQSFLFKQIGSNKAKALKALMKCIDPDMRINAYDRRWTPDDGLAGFCTFLCVDSMEVRTQAFGMMSEACELVVDFRMGATNGTVYAGLGLDPTSQTKLLAVSDYTTEEAMAATPRSACGESISLYPNVVSVVAAGMAVFQRYCMDHKVPFISNVNYYDARMSSVPVLPEYKMPAPAQDDGQLPEEEHNP